MNRARPLRGVVLLVAAALAPGATEVRGVAAQEPLSWGAMQDEVREREPSAATRIEYGPGPNRFGELRVTPGPGPHPVAIVLHGGCWLSIADLAYMRPLASELERLGWATWTLEFNRIDEPEGSWPGILEDVAAGADLLHDVAEEHALDLGRVAAVGHSSGGHLALWLSARNGAGGRDASRPQRGGGVGPLTIHGVLGLAPVAALQDFQSRSVRCGSGIVDRLVGSPPGRAGQGIRPDDTLHENRLDATDPERMLPLGVDQLLVFGEEDGIVPPAHGRAWRRLAEAAGDRVEVQVVPGAGHFEVVAPWTTPWTDVGLAIRSFLSSLNSGA